MTIDSLMGALKAASGGMAAQSLRLRVATENLANVDTPGYQRKLMTFRNQAGEVRPGRISLDRSAPKTIYDPAHPLADATGSVTMSNVDMMIELADAREAGRSYDANLQSFNQARRLYSGLWEILKR